MSRTGLIIMLAGLVIMLMGAVSPALTIVNVGSTSTATSVTAPVSSEYPSSTSQSTPTIFAHHSFADIGYNWYTEASATSTSSGGSTAVPASLQITSSNGYTNTEVVSVVISVQITSAGGLYHAIISGSAMYNFSNPYSSSTPVFAFTIIPSSTAVTVGSYSITLQNSTTTYGQFPSNAIQGIGHFYVGITLTSLQKITSTSQVLWLNVSGFPTQLYVVYIEDNGTTTNWGSIYFTYSETTTSGTVVATNQEVTLATASNGGQATTQFTINGNTYSGYYAQISISSPSQIVLNGYVTNESSGQAIQLMSIFGNVSTQSQIVSLNENQEITVAVGAVVFIAGAIWTVKRR